jgi:hypothetical protein
VHLDVLVETVRDGEGVDGVDGVGQVEGDRRRRRQGRDSNPCTYVGTAR